MPTHSRKSIIDEREEYRKKRLEQIQKPIEPFKIDFAPRIAESQPEHFHAGDLAMVVMAEEGEVFHRISHCYLGILKSLREITDKLKQSKNLEVEMNRHLDIRALSMRGLEYNVSYSNMQITFYETPKLPASDFIIALYETAPNVLAAFGVRKAEGLLMPAGRFVEYNKKTPSQ